MRRSQNAARIDHFTKVLSSHAGAARNVPAGRVHGSLGICNSRRKVQIAAHASNLLAGSETTATALSCIVYHLCHTPRALERVKKEIRNGFAEYQDINATTTSNLEYLNAVILEGLRIYPPLPFALPRIVPDGGDIVDGYWLPAKVRHVMTSYKRAIDRIGSQTVVSTNPYAACLDSKTLRGPFNSNQNNGL